MVRFIQKQSQSRRISRMDINQNNIVFNNKEEKKEVMNTAEKVAMAQEILSTEDNKKQNVKRIRKDKGLIERTESSKTILTEDNKELLVD
jgi:hypothetical protein|nr:MAG TPA: hypothetical protein [Caudoviricetes sp.]